MHYDDATMTDHKLLFLCKQLFLLAFSVIAYHHILILGLHNLVQFAYKRIEKSLNSDAILLKSNSPQAS